MREFYGSFAAAYGTLWLLFLAFSLLTRSQIETGWIGMFGFPAGSLIYALSRTRKRSTDVSRLRRRVEQLEAKLDERESASPGS